MIFTLRLAIQEDPLEGSFVMLCISHFILLLQKHKDNIEICVWQKLANEYDQASNLFARTSIAIVLASCLAILMDGASISEASLSLNILNSALGLSNTSLKPWSSTPRSWPMSSSESSAMCPKYHLSLCEGENHKIHKIKKQIKMKL